MNTDEINDQVLEHLADMHRTRFFTSALSHRIGDASLDELILYGYGVIAGSDEAEERREGREVRPHEGYLDCETSPHFWRGVCEARRAEIGMPLNRKPRKKTDEEGRRYARFKVRGSPFLLSRLRDFFQLYSVFPDVASGTFFLEQANDPKGFVQLNGTQAYKAIYSLYQGASVGGMVEKAGGILEALAPGCWESKPRRPDLSKLRPIPDDVFEDKPAPLARISQRTGASGAGQRGSSGA